MYNSSWVLIFFGISHIMMSGFEMFKIFYFDLSMLAFCHKWITDESFKKLIYSSFFSFQIQRSSKLLQKSPMQKSDSWVKRFIKLRPHFLSQRLKTNFYQFFSLLREIFGANIFLTVFSPGQGCKSHVRVPKCQSFCPKQTKKTTLEH